MPAPVYAPTPCEACKAKCCTNQAPWNFIQLTPAEEAVFEKKVKVEIVNDETLGKGWFFDDETGACPFLGEDKRCTVYDERPEVCRKFICTNKQFQGVDLLLKNNPDLAALLNTRAK